MQIGGLAKIFLIEMGTLSIEQDDIPGGRAAMSSCARAERWICSLRMRCINLMPEIVIVALLNRLNPRIRFNLDLMWR